MTKLTLSILPDMLSICRLPPGSTLPKWGLGSAFFSITATEEELSIVCRTEDAPSHVRQSGGWRALKVEGPLDFSLTGVLAGLAVALAAAEVSIFAISTFDTDYVLVQEKHLESALAALRSAGYGV